jgi:lambda repressor-like predicted transcriptional regulator
MLTRNKADDFRYLTERGYAFGNVVAFFLKDAGWSLADIAKTAGVTRSMMVHAVAGRRQADRVRETLSKALGFDPWKVAGNE